MNRITEKLPGVVSQARQVWTMEKTINANQLHMIHKKNKLMLAVFIILVSCGLVTNLFIFPVIVPVIIITSIVGFAIVTYFVRHPNLAKQGMYVIVCISFVPFWVIAYLDLDVINFFFLTLPLIMSSIYNRLLPIIIASALTFITMIYFYFYYYEAVFYNNLKVDVFYFLLFTLFVTVYLIFSSRFIGNILHKAEEKEKRTTRELLSTKEYLEAYFNNTTDAIGVYDLSGMLLNANGSFEKMFAVNAEKYIGTSTDFLSFTSSKSLNVLQTKLDNQKQLSFELLTHTAMEIQIDVNITVTPVRGENGEILALVFLIKDVTDKKRTEEALMQSEKLSVIGELAAGVAHEIRNPVTVLKGFVHLLSKETDDKEFYHIMDKELERINQITNEFMALAKPQAIKIKKVNFKNLIQEVYAFLESEAFIHQVTIEVYHPNGEIWIDCEPNQIKQVLINIIKNGMEAMPSGGKIHIQTGLKNEYVHLAIKDEGCGIPKDLLDKVGKPFFTTKDNGTGLGLMVSMKIIENHSGNFIMDSKEQSGTTVNIYLPFSTAAKPE